MSVGGDAAHDAATSGGVADEVSSGGGSPAAATIDAESDPDVAETNTDLVDGALSPGSTATGAPTA